VTGRGTTNQNDRGSAEARRSRRAWIMSTYGRDGLVLCYRCELVMFADEFEVDRITPGCRGGTYARDNIRPACGPCNRETGNAIRDGILI
jgi:HNH endonuclease